MAGEFSSCSSCFSATPGRGTNPTSVGAFDYRPAGQQLAAVPYQQKYHDFYATCNDVEDSSEALMPEG